MHHFFFVSVILGLSAVATLTSAQKSALVVIVNNGTSSVSGLVYFSETEKGIHISGNITGLAPGTHGFHVHALGDISGGCLSTGAHFNPYNASHGAPGDQDRHVGDLGNIEASETGVAYLDFYDSVIALSGENSIIGRGVVVHEDSDDLGLGGFEDSKTTGHAGARVGCGVIGTLDETNDTSSGFTVIPKFGLMAAIVLILHTLY